ncbi:MAG: ADP-ribosylglycohydrolase family protein [Bacillus subtilis]|nr:ADP-ribosylglycohydrolase family protein [Bacillus subtilis]
MKQYLTGALVANAACMGFNWIYNMPYLDKLASVQSLVFQPIDPAKYKRAGKAYLAYPQAVVGDVSLQGEIAKWLYAALKDNPDLTRDQYKAMIYDQIKPGGTYVGWVESYGKKLVINELNQFINAGLPVLTQDDDQLVGFIPYLVAKELGRTNDQAWDLAQLFTNLGIYREYYDLFDRLFEAIQSKPLREALESVVTFAPEQVREALTNALSMTDTLLFITRHAGTACHIPQAIPLIFHLLYHSSSYEEAVKWNVKIGGASADRAMLLGAFAAQGSPIPQDWIAKTFPAN